MNTEIKNNEILFYQIDAVQKLEVKVENDTVWLNRQQLSILFGRDVKTIGKHINNALKEELKNIPTVANFAIVHSEGGRIVTRNVDYYNLDMILSVGYRVKSDKGILFRRWANEILKNVLFKGYALSSRVDQLEYRMNKAEHQIGLSLQTSLLPKQGVFCDGQIFDAYQFVSDLIRSAKQSIVLFDSYADDSVLKQLTKRAEDVSATIVVGHISDGLRLDVRRHNAQYAPIQLVENATVHDRFLLIDDKLLYNFGASFKDLGKKLFCFSNIESEEVINLVKLKTVNCEL